MRRAIVMTRIERLGSLKISQKGRRRGESQFKSCMAQTSQIEDKSKFSMEK